MMHHSFNKKTENWRSFKNKQTFVMAESYLQTRWYIHGLISNLIYRVNDSWRLLIVTNNESGWQDFPSVFEDGLFPGLKTASSWSSSSTMCSYPMSHGDMNEANVEACHWPQNRECGILKMHRGCYKLQECMPSCDQQTNARNAERNHRKLTSQWSSIKDWRAMKNFSKWSIHFVLLLFIKQ